MQSGPLGNISQFRQGCLDATSSLLIGICNEILKATPSLFTGWHAMESLAPSLATVEATRQVLQRQVDVLRQRGVSWDAIGKSLGVSRQAAWERFS